MSFECFAVSVETPPSLLDSRIDVLLLLVLEREGFLDLVDFFFRKLRQGRFLFFIHCCQSVVDLLCPFSMTSSLNFCKFPKNPKTLPSFLDFFGDSLTTTGPPSILGSEFDSREL